MIVLWWVGYRSQHRVGNATPFSRDIGSMKGEIAATRHAVAVAKMLDDDAKGCIVKGFQVKK
ncbi:MAG: hypothetical protein GY822_09890 [Deltaproteobacteria bacterium]|nr:hypothetical protein [Deltaproteobacteria bacterium]